MIFSESVAYSRIIKTKVEKKSDGKGKGIFSFNYKPSVRYSLNEHFEYKLEYITSRPMKALTEAE